MFTLFPSSLLVGLATPSKPLNLAATVISSSSVTLSWDPPSMLGDTVELYLAVVGLDIQDTFSYSYSYYSEIQNQSQIFVEESTLISVPFEFVQFLQNNNDSALNPLPIPCGFPELYSPSQFNMTAILPNDTLEDIGSVNYYGVTGGQIISQRSFPGAPAGVFIVNLTVTNETSHTFEGLCPFTTYKFSVSAVNREGGGPYAEISATTFEDGVLCVYVRMCMCVCVYVLYAHMHVCCVCVCVCCVLCVVCACCACCVCCVCVCCVCVFCCMCAAYAVQSC